MYFYISTFRSMCAVPNMAVFCSSLIYVFLLWCSRILWMVLKWFLLLLLLPISPKFLYSTYTVYLLWDLYISKYYKLASESHSYLLYLRHLSTYLFPFHYCVLQCLACYWVWSCQFLVVHYYNNNYYYNYYYYYII
jgi:hypothetical protein